MIVETEEHRSFQATVTQVLLSSMPWPKRLFMRLWWTLRPPADFFEPEEVD